MHIDEIIDNFLNKYPVNEGYNNRKIAELAINCLSLSETWKMNNNIKGSLTISTYDNEDLLIDSMHGCSWDTIPVELMNICFNRSDKVRTIRLFGYKNNDNTVKSVMVGELEIS